MRSIHYLALALTVFALASFFACTTPEKAGDPQPLVEQETSGPPMSAEPEAELEQIKTRLEEVKSQLFSKGSTTVASNPLATGAPFTRDRAVATTTSKRGRPCALDAGWDGTTDRESSTASIPKM